MSEPLVIVFPIYQGVTQLDFTGPLQFLRHMPGAEIIVASVDGADVESEGLHFTQLRLLPEIARCDVLCVPGGSGCTQALQDEAFMRQIRRLGADARYLTSVCTGSLILAAAGLLPGKRAACYWSMRDSLKLFGAIPSAARVERDGNVISGGGVTAGIDFALALIAELHGEDTAQTIQLYLSTPRLRRSRAAHRNWPRCTFTPRCRHKWRKVWRGAEPCGPDRPKLAIARILALMRQSHKE